MSGFEVCRHYCWFQCHLSVICIITESTVATIAYGLDKNASKEKVGVSGIQRSFLIAAANAYSKQVILVLMCGSSVHLSFAEAIDDALVHKFLLENEPCFFITLFSSFHSRGSQATSLEQVLDAMAESIPCANYDSWRVCVPEGEFFSSIGPTEFFKYLERYTGRDLVKEWGRLLDAVLPMLEAVMTLPPLSNQVTYEASVAPFCVEGEILKATVLHNAMVVQGIKSNIVIYTNLIHEFCNECKLLEVGFVLGAGSLLAQVG